MVSARHLGDRVPANAQYTVQVTQTDGATNSGSGTSTFVIDTTAPAPTVTAPANGSFTTSTQPGLAGTAGTNTATSTTSADTTTVTVKIYAGSGTGGALQQTFSSVAVTAGAWSVPGGSVTALPANAQYTVQVTQTDGATNSGSGTSTFVIDTTAPAPTVTAPANGSFTNSTQPGLAGTAGTNTGTATTSADTTTVTVKIFTGPNTAGTLKQTFSSVAVTAGAWSVPGTSVTALPANAQYTVQVTQQLDGATNSGSGTSTFVIDTTAPTGSITAPTAASTVGGTTPLTATASDPVVGGFASGVASVQFQIKANGGSFAPVGTVTSSSYTMNWDSTTVVNGSTQVEAIVTDNAGNTFTTAPVTFTVTNTFQVQLAVAGNKTAVCVQHQRYGTC